MAEPVFAIKCRIPAITAQNGMTEPTFTVAHELYKTDPRMHPSTTAVLTGPVGGLYLVRAYVRMDGSTFASPQITLLDYNNGSPVTLCSGLGSGARPSGATAMMQMCNHSAVIASITQVQVLMRFTQSSGAGVSSTIEFSLRRVCGI